MILKLKQFKLDVNTCVVLLVAVRGDVVAMLVSMMSNGLECLLIKKKKIVNYLLATTRPEKVSN
tara:strand:- start:366 stop:557 length:192 start_codon:yes stop_codon:yes gene_type:complete